jgi:alkylhydroperoxidase family enzyme
VNLEESELDGLIARNISDLEAALTRVQENIDPKLNAEAWNTLKQALHDAEYHFEDDDDLNEAWFAPKAWLDEEGDSDPWFRLNARDGSTLETWLACYVAPRSERDAIGLQWYHNQYVRDYKAVLDAHAEELHRIEQSGFRRDGNNIYLPISFDTEQFAEGFREGNLSEALAPIVTAADALERARPSFQRLRDAMVAVVRTALLDHNLLSCFPTATWCKNYVALRRRWVSDNRWEKGGINKVGLDEWLVSRVC